MPTVLGKKSLNFMSYISREAVCPFYKMEDGAKLRCEGFCPTCSIQITFEKRDIMRMHKRRHCNSFKGYPQCPLYPVINAQYEDEP